MTINLIETGGLKAALKAMRMPMDSGKKSDTVVTQIDDNISHYNINVGELDKDLSSRLQKAGPEHCKHLRQVMVWIDIKAPRQW